MKLKFSAIAILSFMTIAAFAQKVKEKEDVYYVDDKPFLKKGCKNEYQDPCLFTSPSGDKKFFSLKPYSYQDSRQVYNGAPGGRTETQYYTAYFFHVKFLSVEKEFYTKEKPKELIKLLYNAAIISSSGDIDEAKLDEFISINGIEPPIIIR